MRLDEYAALDGIALADLVRTGQVTARQTFEAALGAIKSTNSKLNFLVDWTHEEAERCIANVVPQAPFAGVPMLIKDIGASVRGVPQELGCKLARGLTPDQDSEIVRRYRAAGFVFAGRSTTPELGASFTTESAATGATRNPWNLERSVGGSSGGAAAAVASGAVPVAHGGDSAGSIRIPAHCCGVFGLKPSRGRNPVGPQNGEVNSGLTAAHVITRTVRDSAAALDATEGPDPGCRYAAPGHAGTFLSAVQQDPPKLRIAMMTHNPFGGTLSQELVAATVGAAQLCESMGHDVEMAAPPFDADEFAQNLETVWTANIHHAIKGLMRAAGVETSDGLIEASTRATAERGSHITADQLLAGLDGMNRFARTLSSFFANYDVLLCPPMADVAPLLGIVDPAEEVEDVSAYIFGLLQSAPFTSQYNVSGQPAMSVPWSMSSDGLPIGVQFVGGYGQESALFSLAGAFERAAPWVSRVPTINAQKLPELMTP